MGPLFRSDGFTALLCPRDASLPTLLLALPNAQLRAGVIPSWVPRSIELVGCSGRVGGERHRGRSMRTPAQAEADEGDEGLGGVEPEAARRLGERRLD